MMKRFATFAVVAVSLGCGTARAQEIQQFDEVCVAQWKFTCLARYDPFAAHIRDLKNPANTTLVRDAAWAGLQRIKSESLQNDAIPDAANEAKCDVAIRAALNCNVTVNLAKAVDKAIRESQEAAMKAWLAALDAREAKP